MGQPRRERGRPPDVDVRQRDIRSGESSLLYVETHSILPLSSFGYDGYTLMLRV